MMRVGSIFLAVLALTLGVGGGLAWGLYAGAHKTFPYDTSRWIKQAVFPSQYANWERFSDVSRRTPAPCPPDALVVFAIGQSNAANELSSYGDRIPDAPAYNFFNGACYEIEDPVLGATGHRGSLWTTFAQDLSARLAHQPVIVITAGVNSSSVREWLDPPEDHSQFALEQLAAANELGLSVDYVVWVQGEADALQYTEGDVYEQALTALINRVDSAAGHARPTWLMFEQSLCSMMPRGSEAIRQAQRNVAARGTNKILVANLDHLGERFRHDECHFNANGTREISRLLVEAITAHAAAQAPVNGAGGVEVSG